MTGPGGAPADALERALLAHEAGNVAAAIGVCQAILDREPRHAGALNLLGVIEAQHGRFAEALRLLDASIEAEPMADAVHWNRGNVLGALGDLAAAATSYRRALVIHPAYAAALYGRATLHLAAGEIASGAVCLGRALASRPDYPEALFALGNVLQALGFTEAALRSYEGVLRLWPSHPGTLTNRASVLLSIGAIGAARASLIEALAVRPDLAEAWCNLGHALVEAKGLTAALRALDRALAIAPNYLMALTNRGNALSELARPDEALSSYDLALAFQPDNILALYNRGNVLWWRKRHRASRVSFERALALDPRHVSAWSSRGGLMLEVKRLGEARSSFARMRAIARDHAQSHATQIFALDFFPELGFPDHQKARRDWFRMHAERHAPEVSRHANTPDPSRRLVVGYVSGDFRAHSAAELFGPVLRRHDRNRFEMVCYSNAALSDRMTAEFQALADRWRPVVGFSDDQVAEAVRADRIDILVDLSGHSAGNRLLVFARKPAPVQVTAWGQASGTGMPMVDYLFGDPVTVPASARPLFAEKIWDLPSLIPYEAPAYAPAIEPGPGGRGEAVTFGCFNRFNKVSADALALWAGIVAAVPGSAVAQGLGGRRPGDARSRSRHHVGARRRRRSRGVQRCHLASGTSSRLQRCRRRPRSVSQQRRPQHLGSPVDGSSRGGDAWLQRRLPRLSGDPDRDRFDRDDRRDR
jgi:predicted O-linked N-acetylglucosamine transferase (SPINDLY family)